MTAIFIFHEVRDGDKWASAWRKGKGSRHELFGQLGIQCQTFRDPQNPRITGVLAHVPDMAKFQAFLASVEGQKAMSEDGLKADTLRVLTEFTP